MSANYKECLHAGIDPRAVDRICSRLERIMKDAEKLGISLFCGGSCPTLRYVDNQELRPLAIAHVYFDNHDGGDGGCHEDEKGLLRGE